MDNRENDNSFNNLAPWFNERPKWQRVAVRKLLESDELTATAIDELVVLCKQEANGEFPEIDYSIPTSTFDAPDSEKIRLCSISEIAGINKLNPRKPLKFGTSNIAVIYGETGSGKSGYVRLLKHICGARNCIDDPLHKDVFSIEDVSQKAKISFLAGNSLEEAEHKWSLDQDICDALCSVDIFDASFGQVFMGGEGEVSYEPSVLLFFTRLIDVCDTVKESLEADMGTLKSTMPNIPEDFLGSDEEKWLNNINARTPTDEIDTYCSFTQEDKTELKNILERLSEPSPTDRAQQEERKKTYVDKIINDFQNYLKQLSDKKCKQIIKAKERFILKQSVAAAASKDVFNDVQIKGIGSDVWKALWNAAREYSEKSAYKGQEFPVVQDDSICVLCLQPLSEEAKQSFISFESYIKGETQNQAVLAEKDVKQFIDALPEIPSVEVLTTKIDAAGIENKEIIKDLIDMTTTLQDRKTKLSSPDVLDLKEGLTSFDQWIKKMRKISQQYAESASKYKADAVKSIQNELQKKRKNLEAKNWLAKEKNAIQEEVNRFQHVKRIQNAKNIAITTVLSTKKGKLSETLITDAFVDRFNKKLQVLGASELKVELIKSKTSKGKVLHTIQLEGASGYNLNEVLSEGEKRIISIAAFLADVTGRNCPTPFVFDDPISSLDQNYEEAVVQQLCSIASERQVIIFTHRLSLLGLVQDYAKKVSIEPEIICIRKELWGTGEPGDTPLFAKKPAKALNQLIDERLPKAKKILEKDGSEAYELKAKALCSDFRIILERMVEHDLMSDVVHRYRRAINTEGKINNLAKISEEDCTFFDKLITQYSKYVHSHSSELPVPLPKPSDLESHFNALKQWQEEFQKRN